MAHKVAQVVQQLFLAQAASVVALDLMDLVVAVVVVALHRVLLEQAVAVEVH
jgi:hypothetical protein